MPDDEEQPDTVALNPRSPAPARPPEDADAFPPGTRAGRYMLLERLGAGGAGLVYSAYDPELDRRVAIKILRSLDDGDQGRARLLREAQAMARLKHPNVLPVYDVGTLEEGSRVFLAMELVEGGTLRAWLREPRSRREILEVMAACGRGLQAAHAAGLVHRDFKPDNVLVEPGGRLFVTDFGLVRAAGSVEAAPPPSALASPLTGVDTVLGTPGYMAPEQYRGEPVDARTDQFSFCVSLCEALSGKHPFAGGTVGELEAAAGSGQFADTLRAARVPQWLVRVIARGLSRDRDARFPDMAALLDALANDPQLRLRRGLLALGGLGAVLALLVGVHALAVRQQQLCHGAERKLDGIWDASARERVRSAFARAGLPSLFESAAAALDHYAHDWVAQHEEACEATRVRGEQPDNVLGLRMGCLESRRKELAALVSLWSEADRDTAFAAAQSAARLSSIRSCGDVAALTARIPPPSDVAARRRVEELRANLARSKVLEDAARYRPARAIVDGVMKEDATLRYGPLRAEALRQRAVLERESDGDMKAAAGSLVDAVAAAYASHDDAQAASAMTDLAMLDGYWLDAHEEGERWSRLAEAAIARLGGSDELEAERLRVEAEILIGEDQGARAVAAAEPALRLAERLYGDTSVQASIFHATLGAAYSTSGDEAKARTHYERQHAILVQLVGPEHPLVAMALNNLGLNAEAEGRYDDAEKDYRQSVVLLKKTLGPEHPRVAIALSNLGMTLRTAHKPAEALAAFQEALAINQRRFGDDYPDSLDALLGQGESLVALGRPKEAEPVLARALALAKSGEGNNWGVAEGEFALAQALFLDGQAAQAKKLAAGARTKMAVEKNRIARRQLAEIDAWITRNGK